MCPLPLPEQTGTSIAVLFLISEVTDIVFDRASECVVKIMHPTVSTLRVLHETSFAYVSFFRRLYFFSQMLETFEKNQPSAITTSGMPDLQQVKQAWNKSCTPQANSITELLVPNQSDEDKARIIFMVETCLNSTIFTVQFEASL